MVQSDHDNQTILNFFPFLPLVDFISIILLLKSSIRVLFEFGSSLVRFRFDFGSISVRVRFEFGLTSVQLYCNDVSCRYFFWSDFFAVILVLQGLFSAVILVLQWLFSEVFWFSRDFFRRTSIFCRNFGRRDFFAGILVAGILLAGIMHVSHSTCSQSTTLLHTCSQSPNSLNMNNFVVIMSIVNMHLDFFHSTGSSRTSYLRFILVPL